MHARAISSPIRRAPSAMTLASLCSRANAADSGSLTSAQRHAGLRLTAIEMPMPEPHNATPYRSEEHTSELQSLMRISYAVFCLKKKTTNTHTQEQRQLN